MTKRTSKIAVLLLSLLLALSLVWLVSCTTTESSDTASDTTSESSSDDESTSSDTEPEEDDTVTKEEILAYLESLSDIEVAEGEVNVYVSEYDDMVAYLQTQGVISADAEPVDMNTTAGYLWEYATGMTTEAIAFADKAYDYGGVYLMWWDIANGSEYEDYYSSYSFSTGTIAVGGGQYTLPFSSTSGFYAIAFADVVEVSLSYSYGAENGSQNYDDYSEYTAAMSTAVAAAEAEYADEIAIFEAIDDTAPLEYATSLSDVAATLRGAGYISAADYVSPTDLNAIYTYTYNDTTCYVPFAYEAYQYGNISIYYYDSSDSWWSFSTCYYIYTNLCNSLTSDIYYDASYGGSWGVEWYNGDVYKYNENNEYDADGTTLTLTVDVVIGNFAFAISE